MLNHWLKILGSLCLVLMLSACSSVSPLPVGVYSHSNKIRLYNVSSWTLDGRVAISSSKDSWSARIEWAHRNNTDLIKLSGPLGQGAVVIEMANGAVKIDRGRGNIQTSTDPETLVNQQLGIFVPLESLRYWAIGLPEPEQDFQETIDGFVQDDWLVSYQAYQQQNNELLPHKMMVSNDQAKLKLIVDQWVLNDGKAN